MSRPFASAPPLRKCPAHGTAIRDRRPELGPMGETEGEDHAECADLRQRKHPIARRSARSECATRKDEVAATTPLLRPRRTSQSSRGVPEAVGSAQNDPSLRPRWSFHRRRMQIASREREILLHTPRGFRRSELVHAPTGTRPQHDAPFHQVGETPGDARLDQMRVIAQGDALRCVRVSYT